MSSSKPSSVATTLPKPSAFFRQQDYHQKAFFSDTSAHSEQQGRRSERGQRGNDGSSTEHQKRPQLVKQSKPAGAPTTCGVGPVQDPSRTTKPLPSGQPGADKIIVSPSTKILALLHPPQMEAVAQPGSGYQTEKEGDGLQTTSVVTDGLDSTFICF